MLSGTRIATLFQSSGLAGGTQTEGAGNILIASSRVIMAIIRFGAGAVSRRKYSTYNTINRLESPFSIKSFDKSLGGRFACVIISGCWQAQMFRLDRFWNRGNRTRVLLVSGVLLVAIAVFDWRTKPYFAVGFLYLFPIMLAAGFLPRWAIAVLGVVCAYLAESFSYLDPADANVRLSFGALAMVGSGLFISEVSRNHQLSLAAQERVQVLVETSPAAIVTVDENGFIELGNRAAAELLLSPDGRLIGHPIAEFLPELHRALRREDGPQFRTTMQCRGLRGNGESFLANVWFSTYMRGATPKLAAIIADVSEEHGARNGSDSAVLDHQARTPLNAREIEVLRSVCQGLANKEIAAKMNISDSGVKNTLQQLFGKTEVRTRSQLVRVALERYRDLL
jgi:PAS domain S-box-containing protein